MSTATIELRMHGVPGSVELAAFGRFLHEFQALTNAVTKDEDAADATWRITDLSIGSALAQAAIDTPDDAPALAGRIILGLEALHEVAAIPPELPIRGLGPAIAMGRAATTRATTLTLIEGGLSARVDAMTSANAQRAKKATHMGLGGFYGRVEMLDIRRGKKFGIRDEFTQRWMPCTASTQEVFTAAQASMADEVRVFVGGEITENAARQPLRIKVHSIEAQPWSEGGSVERFRGSDPAIAGERSAAEWVRMQRDW